MNAAAESHTHNPALDATQIGGPTPTDLAWERVEKTEQRLEGPVAAEDRPRLLKEVRERRAQLEAEDEDETAQAVYALREKLFGHDPDKVILERRVTTAIPAAVVQEARDMIAAHQLRQRTRAWNVETRDAPSTGKTLSGGVSGQPTTTHFPKIAPDSDEKPAMFKLKNPGAAERRRQMALARAQKEAARKAVPQQVTHSENDAAAIVTPEERSGVRPIPRPDLPPPTPVKLPSPDASNWQ